MRVLCVLVLVCSFILVGSVLAEDGSFVVDAPEDDNTIGGYNFVDDDADEGDVKEEELDGGMEAYEEEEEDEDDWEWENSADDPNVVKQFRPVITMVCWMEIEMNHRPLGRVTFGLYGHEMPILVNNFLTYCHNTDEQHSYRGGSFYAASEGLATEGGGNYDEVALSAYDDQPFEADTPHLHSTWPGALMATRNTDATHSFMVGMHYISALQSTWATHPVFGEVLSGMDIIERINKVPVTDKDHVLGEYKIVEDSIRIVDSGEIAWYPEQSEESFHFANQWAHIGEFAKAEEYYKDVMESTEFSFPEERMEAGMRLGALKQKQHADHDTLIDHYKQVYHVGEDKWIDPLMSIADILCLQQSDNDACYAFLEEHNISRRVQPVDSIYSQVLHYRFTRWDYYGICAYYVDELTAGRDAVVRALEADVADEKERLLKNLNYYNQKLKARTVA